MAAPSGSRYDNPAPAVLSALVTAPDVVTVLNVASPGGGFAAEYAPPCQLTSMVRLASAHPCSTRPLRARAAGTVNRASAGYRCAQNAGSE